MKPLDIDEKQRDALIRKVKYQQQAARIRQSERLQRKREKREEKLFAVIGITLVCILFAWAWWLSP